MICFFFLGQFKWWLDFERKKINNLKAFAVELKLVLIQFRKIICIINLFNISYCFFCGNKNLLFFSVTKIFWQQQREKKLIDCEVLFQRAYNAFTSKQKVDHSQSFPKLSAFFIWQDSIYYAFLISVCSSKLCLLFPTILF